MVERFNRRATFISGLFASAVQKEQNTVSRFDAKNKPAGLTPTFSREATGDPSQVAVSRAKVIIIDFSHVEGFLKKQCPPGD
jgi:hypothetical protein